MILPLVLYAVFTVLLTLGVFWIGKAQHSLAMGIGLAILALLFMGALYAGLALWLWPQLEGVQ